MGLQPTSAWEAIWRLVIPSSAYHLASIKTFALFLLFTNTASATESKPIWSKAEIERVCLRALPMSGFVLVPADGGGWMKCECLTLRKKSLTELDSMRAARDSVTMDRLKQRKAVPAESPGKMEPLPSLTFRDIPFVYSTLDERIQYRSYMECEEERRLLRIVENIGQLPGISSQLTRRFRIGVDPNMTGPRIEFQSGVDQNTVFIPKRLLYSPLMSDELLVFLILHELGHDLGDPFVGQEAPDGMIPEFMADRWAVTEGLPAYYSTDLAIALIPMIASDFKAYRESMYDPLTVERSSCDPAPYDSYPTQDCRLHGITNGVWPEVDPLDLLHGYPSYCWSPAHACGFRALDITNPNDTLCCEQEPFPVLIFNETSVSFTPEWQALLNVENIIANYCSNQNRCGPLFSLSKDWLRSNIKRYNARERSIKHHFDKARSKMEGVMNGITNK